jgi:hypothetical protein
MVELDRLRATQVLVAVQVVETAAEADDEQPSDSRCGRSARSSVDPFLPAGAGGHLAPQPIS